MPTMISKTIRSLDKELYKQARIAAIDAGVSIGQWINEAIRTQLNFEEEATTYCREQGWQEPR